ncbi:tetratricopeptide repeat protein [bacterium]|nr:tetratricopeptide repeat protein [bacterium]
MKKKLGLLLAAVMVLNTVSTAVFAWENPLTKYNLYDDTHPVSNNERENVMNDYYSNSLSNQMRNNSTPVETLDYNSLSNFTPEPEMPAGRNETLRESSRNVYSDEETPGWEEGPSFYPEPSFDSIVEKYRRSDFAGCLQECISYVRLHPNDTLGFYYLAMCYTKVSDKDNAIKAYERVIALNDNPMIVKYATNGRNCVMENDNEKCYQNVNEPELIYPYANLSNMDLTPVDPQTLVDRNLSRLKNQLSPQVVDNNNNNNNSNDPNAKKDVVTLPFGNQDDKLDQFINAPYGNGLSPELNKQYKQLQLKRLQETINKGEESNGKDNYDEMKDIKKFDKQKSDSETIKLAYDTSASFESIAKDPDYIKQKQELDELHMLLGNEKSKDNSDMMDLLPYMTEQGGKNLSPEVIQSMMMRSMMGDLTL